jgi:hypothetical protein
MKSDIIGFLGFGIHTSLFGCIPAPNIAETADLLILFSNLVSASPIEGCDPEFFSTIAFHSDCL